MICTLYCCRLLATFVRNLWSNWLRKKYEQKNVSVTNIRRLALPWIISEKLVYHIIKSSGQTLKQVVHPCSKYWNRGISINEMVRLTAVCCRGYISNTLTVWLCHPYQTTSLVPYMNAWIHDAVIWSCSSTTGGLLLFIWDQPTI